MLWRLGKWLLGLGILAVVLLLVLAVYLGTWLAG